MKKNQIRNSISKILKSGGVIFAFNLIAFSCFAQNVSPRFGIVPNDDNTGRVLTYYYYTPKDTGYHDTAKFTPHGFETFIQPGDSIKDTLYLYANTTRSNVCDKIEFQCVGADTLFLRKHVIFTKGFKGFNLNIPVAAKKSYHITFMFDGNAWRETSYMAGN